MSPVKQFALFWLMIAAGGVLLTLFWWGLTYFLTKKGKS